MADKTIPDLPAAASAVSGLALDGGESVHVVQGGNSREAMVKDFAMRVRRTLASAFSSTSTTNSVVTDGADPWTVNVKAGRVYKLRVNATYQSAATTTGGRLTFQNPVGAAGTITGMFRGAISAAAAATGLAAPVSSLSSSLTTTGVSAINTPHAFEMDAVFVCTADGSFELGWASEVSGSASQLNAGSTLIVEDIT